MSIASSRTSTGRPIQVHGTVPLFGHLPQLARRPLEFLREAQAYGEVVTIRIGWKSAYFVNQPDQLKTLLVTSAGSFDKGVHFERARAVLGNGLPCAEGALHRRQRKLMRPAFQKAKLRDYSDIMRESTLAAISSWPTGQEFDLSREIQSLTTTIAGVEST